MLFFGKSISSARIEIDPRSTSASSPEVAMRLTRIEGNYQRLEAILTELESKFEFDDRLAADSTVNVKLPRNPR